MKYPSTSVLLVTFAFACGATDLLSSPTSAVRTANLLIQKAASAVALKINIPYADAKPIFQALREDLWPAELTAKTSGDLDAIWPEWVSRRDAIIRARVREGDEDSIVHLLLFGTAFTKASLVTQHQLAALDPMAWAIESSGISVSDGAHRAAPPEVQTAAEAASRGAYMVAWARSFSRVQSTRIPRPRRG